MKSFNMIKPFVVMLVLCCSFGVARAQSPTAKATGDQVKLNQLNAGTENPAMPGLVYPNTGNAEADAAQYELNKQAAVHQLNPYKVTITRAEFNALPAEKQTALLADPNYVITDPTTK
jgi:hypothetical protein